MRLVKEFKFKIMAKIKFGIDLGTTNSAIAKVEKGKVMILGEKVAAEVSLPAEEVIEESDEYWR